MNVTRTNWQGWSFSENRVLKQHTRHYQISVWDYGNSLYAYFIDQNIAGHWRLVTYGSNTSYSTTAQVQDFISEAIAELVKRVAL